MRQRSRLHRSFGHLCAVAIPSMGRVFNMRLREYGGIVESLERIPRGTYPLDAYHQLVKAGTIKLDAGQVAALQPLERLHRELETYEQSTPGVGNKFFSAVGLTRPKVAPQGVYIHGGVGTGKSLVADIFFHCSPIQNKRRVHFHQFMLDIHKSLHNMRTSQRDVDVVEVLASDVLKSGWLLCFDEFQVTDIADAMLLKRLLENLFKGGGIMVASSNRAPAELYKNGIQRELFLPCIELIKSRCQVYAFRPQASDYRLIGTRPEGSRALDKVWHQPLDDNTAKKMELGFQQLAGDRAIGRTILKEGSRTIEVPKAAGGVAAFTFKELCGAAKGAADYLAIASSFHTVFISGIPRLTRVHSELVRRFITLVDIFYEQKVKVIISAETDPGILYQPRAEDSATLKGKVEVAIPSTGSKYVESDEEFAFARTVSRLNHMQTSDYLSSAWADPGKAFICHLESATLLEGDLRRVWDRYNADSDSKLSKDELLSMMEDLTEIKSGHRHVSSELVEDMYKKLDANGDGIVVWTEFRDYFLRYGLQVQAV
uniref:EF-hand domain-containing protein n=1 Tax=Physcomitrium patens TaxID=3218 RepID=A0A2K1KUX4_PHYPA|nr:AFG1-like ATPase isoform X2 [Physcomitrium patens]PNR57593.1 hypothetical protein PHYPA_004587 [Physcomitrium patens]|eukprot:XP_024371800.1 AFG1-like ATPase isoform X2 [Physcomitrella patens]